MTVERARMAAARPDPQSFDHLPHRYDRLAELLGGEIDAYLTARLPPHGGRAADLGCGSGVHTTHLAECYEEVLAVDISAPMLELARQKRPRPNIDYQQRSLDDLTPDRDGTFDLVFSAYTLHHVADLDATLARIRSLVRPGGQVILIDICDERCPTPRSWFRRNAVRAFVRDLRRRRRFGEAAEQLRLSLDRDWLDHQTTDRPLSPAGFAEHYLGAFPGGTLTELDRARAFHHLQEADGGKAAIPR